MRKSLPLDARPLSFAASDVTTNGLAMACLFTERCADIAATAMEESEVEVTGESETLITDSAPTPAAAVERNVNAEVTGGFSPVSIAQLKRMGYQASMSGPRESIESYDADVSGLEVSDAESDVSEDSGPVFLGFGVARIVFAVTARVKGGGDVVRVCVKVWS